MKKRNFIFLLYFLLYFLSCAPLGTKFKKYYKGDIERINNIGIVIDNTRYFSLDIGKTVDSIFINQLLLDTRKIFKCKVDFIGVINNKDTENLNRLKDSTNFDALLKCNVDPYIMFTFRTPYTYNATARTYLVKTSTRALIASSKFNTNFGKTYWRHPFLEVAVKDAATGALVPYSKKTQIK